MIVQELINTAFQLVVVLLISVLVWLGVFYIGKKRENFFSFVGLTIPTRRAMLMALAVAAIVVPLTVLVFLTPPMHALATAPNTVIGVLRTSGYSAEIVGVIVVIAFFKTSLSEEIFFRGLIGKRLIRGLGFQVGNAIQATLFGCVHMLIFLVPNGPAFDPLIAAFFFAVTTGGAWAMGWLNERVGNGSIAPGWLLHALANALAYPVLAYSAG